MMDPKVLIVSDLIPGYELDSSRRINRAVFDLMVGCVDYGVNILRCVKPLHSVNWRLLRFSRVFETVYEDA